MTKELLSKTHKYRQKILISMLLLIFGTGFYWFLVKLGFIFSLDKIPDVMCIKPCPVAQQVHTLPPDKQLLNYDKPLEQLIVSPLNKSKVSVLIQKSQYRLTVYYDLKPVKSYPVVFGSNPTDDKRSEGDQRTPEGVLRIHDLYPHPQWSKFLWLDYPNVQSWRKHFQSKINGQLTWFLPVGGDVGIHGVPQGADYLINNRENWTWGCISLKNKDVDEIYQAVKVGTIVEIIP